jgi:hypothetical protein
MAVMLHRVVQRLPEDVRGLPGVLEFGSTLVMVVPGLLRALGEEGYLVWVLGQSLVLLIAGVAFQRRLVVGPAVAFIGVVAFRSVLAGAQVLPGWVSLGSGGILLLTLGFVLLLGRNAWLRWQRFLVALWGRWE